MKKWNILLGITFLIVQVLFGAEQVINESFRVNPGGKLIIKTQRGSIQVDSQEKNEVNVKVVFISKSGSEEKLKTVVKDMDLKILKQDNEVHVTLDDDHDSFFNSRYKHINVKFIVTVPQMFNAECMTSGGSIDIGNLNGDIISKTSGGSLRFGKITGNINGNTSGGSIQLDNCTGSVQVNTSGGSIDIGDVSGEVIAHTSGGGISIAEVGGVIDASTSGGSINATITGQPKNDCQLTTSGGTVTVTLNDDIRLNVDAKTSGGSISTDFPVMVQGNMSGKTLHAEINGGGPLLLLRTSGGNINIKKNQ